MQDSKRFSGLPDLAAAANGGRILFATDDFFGEAEKLLERQDPIWDESRYNEFGAFYFLSLAS
jgi:allantoicase